MIRPFICWSEWFHTLLHANDKQNAVQTTFTPCLDILQQLSSLGPPHGTSSENAEPPLTFELESEQFLSLWQHPSQGLNGLFQVHYCVLFRQRADGVLLASPLNDHRHWHGTHGLLKHRLLRCSCRLECTRCQGDVPSYSKQPFTSRKGKGIVTWGEEYVSMAHCNFAVAWAKSSGKINDREQTHYIVSRRHAFYSMTHSNSKRQRMNKDTDSRWCWWYF